MTWQEGRSFLTLRSLVRLTGPRAVVPFLVVFAIILPFIWQGLFTRVSHDGRIDVAASVRTEDGDHLVNVRVEPIQVPRVLDTVEDGLRAQVMFLVRHYGPSDDFAGILGDTLIEELSVSRTLSYDPFTAQYLVEDSRGPERRHDSVVTAIRDLYRVTDVEIGNYDSRYFIDGTGEIRVRAIVTPMVVADPVFLAAPLLGERMVSSPWVRVVADAPEGEGAP